MIELCNYAKGEFYAYSPQKEDITESIEKLLKENYVIVDLETGEKIEGKINIPESILRESAIILAKRMLDYARSGGDTSQMTPENIFGKKEKAEGE